jgi:hypothetical protein
MCDLEYRPPAVRRQDFTGTGCRWRSWFRPRIAIAATLQAIRCKQHVESVRGVTAPPLILDRIGVLSDDECMRRLAHAVETHLSGH